MSEPFVSSPHIGAGLTICFVPLPVHVPVALAVAALARVNVPVILSTVFLVNPLTVVPVYYVAYRVGCFALGAPDGAFSFELSWDWLQNGLGPMWKPFLAGCALCGVAAGVLGWLLRARPGPSGALGWVEWPGLAGLLSTAPALFRTFTA